MTTIIRLNNANFNNLGLPVIPRIVPGNIGFAVKPSTSNGFVDFTGNATVSSVIGSPVLSDTGVTCGDENGYRMSTTDSSDEFTACGVVTCTETPSFMPVGCYDTDNNQGWGVFTNSGDIKAVCYNASGTNTLITAEDANSGDPVFFAITVSIDTMTLYYSSGGALVSSTNSATYSGRSKDSSAEIGVGASARSTWPVAEGAVHELSLHQRVLSASEIQTMYGYAKAYQSAVNGISI